MASPALTPDAFMQQQGSSALTPDAFMRQQQQPLAQPRQPTDTWATYLPHTAEKLAKNLNITNTLDAVGEIDNKLGDGDYEGAWESTKNLIPSILRHPVDTVGAVYQKVKDGDYSGATADMITHALVLHGGVEGLKAITPEGVRGTVADSVSNVADTTGTAAKGFVKGGWQANKPQKVTIPGTEKQVLIPSAGQMQAGVAASLLAPISPEAAHLGGKAVLAGHTLYGAVQGVREALAERAAAKAQQAVAEGMQSPEEAADIQAKQEAVRQGAQQAGTPQPSTPATPEAVVPIAPDVEALKTTRIARQQALQKLAALREQASAAPGETGPEEAPALLDGLAAAYYEGKKFARLSADEQESVRQLAKLVAASEAVQAARGAAAPAATPATPAAEAVSTPVATGPATPASPGAQALVPATQSAVAQPQEVVPGAGQIEPSTQVSTTDVPTRVADLPDNSPLGKKEKYPVDRPSHIPTPGQLARRHGDYTDPDDPLDSSTVWHNQNENQKGYNLAHFAWTQGQHEPELLDPSWLENATEDQKRLFANGEKNAQGEWENGALSHGREVGNPTPPTQYKIDSKTKSIIGPKTMRLFRAHLEKMVADGGPEAPEGQPAVVAPAGQAALPAPATALPAPERAGETVERLRTAVESGQNAPVGQLAGGRESGTAGTGETGPRRLTGENTSALIPGEDVPLGGRYEVREFDDLAASHSGETFQNNPDYAHHNERDYSKAENQQRILNQASEEKFNPRYLITDNPDATNGPPVVDERGNVLGGNSRVMTLERVYGRKGQAAESYRKLLEQKAAQFGIDPAQLADFKNPVLVRVAGDSDLSAFPGGAKGAIRKTNVSGTAQLSGAERATADAGQFTPELKQSIADAIEQSGPDATLNEALSGKAGTQLVNHLIAKGFFSEQERPALMDGKTGAITQLAKDRIAKSLVGDFFHDSDQFQRFPASLKQKLERVAAPLASVATDSAWDLTPKVRNAVDLIEYADAHGIKNFADVVSQRSMFGGGEPQWTPEGIRLAEWLRDAKPNDIVKAFRQYAASKEPTMFGESTPAQAFDYAFPEAKPEPAAQTVERMRKRRPAQAP